MIHGRNLILAIGGVPIAGAKGCTVDRDTDTIEVCSPTDGAAKTYIPGTTGWSASANGLYATTEKANILRQIWRNYQNGITTPIQIQYTTGNQVEHGTAILTSLKESGEVGGLMKFSIKLQGSGKLGEETYTDIQLTTWDGGEEQYFDITTSPWSTRIEQESNIVTTNISAGVYDVCCDGSMIFVDDTEVNVRVYINIYDIQSVYEKRDEDMTISEESKRMTLTKAMTVVANSIDNPTITKVVVES